MDKSLFVIAEQKKEFACETASGVVHGLASLSVYYQF